jgi:tripartite-type tricarboxylate transporter receptor subunit TctC
VRKIAGVILAVGLVFLASRVLRDRPAASRWPEKPVRLLIPSGTGSGLDLTARLFAERLARRWGRPVVVDNRPGAEGLVGVAAFAAAPDDHTLLFTFAAPVTFNPQVQDRLPYDPERDLVPISIATRPTIVIAGSKALSATSLGELVSLVRQEPRRFFWTAIPGLPELVFSAFLDTERLEMTHVGYREIAPALQDLGAGRVHVMVGSLSTLDPPLQAGTARLLAVTNTARAYSRPDVPTVAEAGYPGLTVDGLFGVFGWRGMPEALRRRLAEDVKRTAEEATLAARLLAMGQTAGGSTPEDFAAALDQQKRQVAAIIRTRSAKHR